MASRLDLQAALKTIVGEDHNVYFQPPPTLQMTYPCIVYKRDDEAVNRANNKLYKRMQGYQVTVIDPDPDSLIPAQVGELPYCSFDRFFAADNLNHDVYNLFF